MEIYYNANTHAHIVKRSIVNEHDAESDHFSKFFMRHDKIHASKAEALQESYGGRVYWYEGDTVYCGTLQQPWQFKPVVDGECVTDWGMNWGDMYATTLATLIDGVKKDFPTSEFVTESSIRRNAKQTNTGLWYVHIHYDGRM